MADDIKWIKIVTDIFDDEKVRLIESMPEADSIIVIWFKLLCLAGKQNNNGVFMLNDKLAYTDEMLSTLFRRPINTVRLSLKTFELYGMIEIIDNVYVIPNWEKHQNIEKMEEKKAKNREKVANWRAKQKQIASCNGYNEVTKPLRNEFSLKDKELEEEVDIKEKDNTIVLSKKKSDDAMELKSNSSFDRTGFDEFVSRFNIQVDNYDRATMSQTEFTALTMAYENSTNFLQRYDEHPMCQFMSWICKNYKSIVMGKYRDVTNVKNQKSVLANAREYSKEELNLFVANIEDIEI